MVGTISFGAVSSLNAGVPASVAASDPGRTASTSPTPAFAGREERQANPPDPARVAESGERAAPRTERAFQNPAEFLATGAVVQGKANAASTGRELTSPANATGAPVQAAPVQAIESIPVRGPLQGDTLKGLIFASQQSSGSKPFPAGAGLSTAPSPAPDLSDLAYQAPNSAVIPTLAPSGGTNTVLASISTNMDGSGSSVTVFSDGGRTQTYNFAAAAEASPSQNPFLNRKAAGGHAGAGIDIAA